ncbi:MAG TPA: hypothetical protein VIN40_03980 [Candidatus Tyrphobacter sp.]
MKRALLFTTLAAAGLLVGCNGYNNGYQNPPGAGTNCIPRANTVLVYPENNATGVPDNTMAVYIALPTALSGPAGFDTNIIGPPSYGAQLTNGFTAVSYGSIPTPNTVPGYSNPQYYESTFRYSLTAATAFSVHWNDLNSACNSNTSASLIGSFTTQ